MQRVYDPCEDRFSTEDVREIELGDPDIATDRAYEGERLGDAARENEPGELAMDSDYRENETRRQVRQSEIAREQAEMEGI